MWSPYWGHCFIVFLYFICVLIITEINITQMLLYLTFLWHSSLLTNLSHKHSATVTSQHLLPSTASSPVSYLDICFNNLQLPQIIWNKSNKLYQSVCIWYLMMLVSIFLYRLNQAAVTLILYGDSSNGFSRMDNFSTE